MMRKITLIISISLVVLFSVSKAQPIKEISKLIASDGSISDYFGESVSISGDYAIVGSYGDDDNGDVSGAAYIFYNNGINWQQQAKLVASDGAEGDGFGLSVGINGDYAIVGARWDDDNTGSAYVYYNNGGIWQQQAKLIAFDGVTDDFFGDAVDISEEFAVVGSTFDDDNGENSGSVYIFVNNGGLWQFQTKILSIDGAEDDWFGASLSISGNDLLVSARLDDDNGDRSGSAYIFSNSGSIWQQQAKLIASDGDAFDYFGGSVCISGNRAIVGSDNDDDNGSSSGSVYIFYNSGGVWQEQIKLTASDATANNYFGKSVSIAGDHAVVSTAYDSNGSSNGSVYLFSYNEGVWQQQTKLIPFDGAEGDHFGESVTISGDYAIVGAPWDDDNGNNSGSIYLFGPPFMNDLSLTSIISPESGQDLGSSIPITVGIKNVGLMPQSNFEVSYIFNGGTEVSETILTILDPEQTLEHTFIPTIDLSSYGTYFIDACVNLTVDQYTGNNCRSKGIVNLIPSLCIDGLYTSGCGTGDGLISWDLAGVNVPIIACDGIPYDWYHIYTDLIHFLNRGNNYILTAQCGYSETFLDVWIDFNDDHMLDNNELVVNDFELAETGVDYEIPLNIPSNAQEGQHILRYRTNWQDIVEGSCDVYSYGNMCDFTVQIEPPLTNNLAITSIVSPESGTGLGNAESVIIEITNHGSSPQSNYEVSYTLDGSNAVTEIVTTPLAFGETLEYTFTTTIDLSAYQIYNIETCANLVDDEDPGNDCQSKEIINSEPSLCIDGLYTSGCNYGDGLVSWNLVNVNVPNIECGNGDPYDWYHDYTNMIHLLNQGENYTLYAKPGYSETFLDVWIDYNDDLILDNDELLIDDFELASTGTTYEITITIPTDAAEGLHILRYRTNWQDVVEGSCDIYSYGNMCDFTAEIIGPDKYSFTVFLEGPFNGVSMNTDINPYPIPLVQPYSDPHKWNYQGAETVTSIPNADVVDWVLIELRETSGDASTAMPESKIAQQAAFILSTGSIVGMDGISPLHFENEINDNLYVVIYHRNHLAVMSSGPLTTTKGEFVWDFTSGAGQAYGTNAQVDLGGVYGMIGGDGDANGHIGVQDKSLNWMVHVGLSGYLNCDLNINGGVDNMDKNDLWLNRIGQSTQIPLVFIPGDPVVDERDGQSYNTIRIGSQTWMVENMNIGTMINQFSDPSNNSIIEKFCFENNISNCDTYGGLYRWNEMMNYVSNEGVRGICPVGWHVPTDNEFTILKEYLGGSAGGKMKEVGFDHWQSPNFGATNSSGFTALPGGGLWGSSGSFYGLSTQANFWTSTEDGVEAWKSSLDNQNANLTQVTYFKEFGFSVRCLKNETINNQPPVYPSNPSPQNESINIYIDTVLSWSCSDPDGDNLTYDIYFGTDPNPPLVLANSLDTSYDPGILFYDTLYYWKVIAFDDPGDYAVGSIWSFTTLENPAPSQPYNPSPQNGSTNISVSSDFSWSCSDPFGDDLAYSIYFGTDSNPPLVELNHVDTFYDPGVLPSGTNCYWKIVAFDTPGDSTIGNIWTFSTNQPPELPSNPSPQNGSIDISIDTLLSWSAIDLDGDNLTYSIYLGTEINPPLIQVNYNDTFYSPGILHYDTTYFWKIVVYDVPGDSTISNIWSFSTELDTWKEVTNPITGRIWMDRNLGASRAATSSLDTEAYGDYYQWGRFNDGHESSYSSTTNTNATTAVPNAGNDWDGQFIIEDYEPFDWLTPQDNTLWHDLDGTNNPCPEGFRIPTIDEWAEERQSWSSNNAEGAFDSPLKLPRSGRRYHSNGSVMGGTNGYYWCSTISWEPTISRYFYFDVNNAFENGGYRANGLSIRCIKGGIIYNQPPSPPSEPQPQNGSTNISVDTILSWSCTDPEGDDLYYKVYLGTQPNPPLAQAYLTDTFYSPIILLHDKVYYWKIVAYDTSGDYTEGDIWGFSTTEQTSSNCGSPIVDDRDGQSYNTEQIGTQCWMTENLNIGTKINPSINQSDNDNIEKYCYDNESTFCNEYGGLYQWNELMNYSNLPGIQGVCPEGWHLPTETEYSTLIDLLGGNTAGGLLKEADTAHWESPNTGASNLSGFTGLPNGQCYNNSFISLGYNSTIWTSSEYDNFNYAKYVKLRYDSDIVQINYESKMYGRSVRCIKNDSLYNLPPAPPYDPSPETGSVIFSLDTLLTWSCFDPDGNYLIYDIYFGTEMNPPLVSMGHEDTFFDLGTLLNDTTYYWKIVAYDTSGDSIVGDVWSFRTMDLIIWTVCGNPFYDDRNGQLYNTVQIGTQCWMAENINVGNMVIGSSNQKDNNIIEKYCLDNDLSSCETYGGLYLWDEMMQYVTTEGAQGICPQGWHIPTDNEWCILEQFLDPTITCSSTQWRGIDGGGKLKEAGTTHWDSPNTGATNSSGFTGLPGGLRHSIGFGSEGFRAHFWTSSTHYSQGPAYYRFLAKENAQIKRYYESTDYDYGYSVRCIKDE